MRRRTFLAGVSALAMMPRTARAQFYRMRGGVMVPCRDFRGDGTPSGGIPGVYKSGQLRQRPDVVYGGGSAEFFKMRRQNRGEN